MERGPSLAQTNLERGRAPRNRVGEGAEPRADKLGEGPSPAQTKLERDRALAQTKLGRGRAPSKQSWKGAEPHADKVGEGPRPAQKKLERGQAPRRQGWGGTKPRTTKLTGRVSQTPRKQGLESWGRAPHKQGRKSRAPRKHVWSWDRRKAEQFKQGWRGFGRSGEMGKR